MKFIKSNNKRQIQLKFLISHNKCQIQLKASYFLVLKKSLPCTLVTPPYSEASAAVDDFLRAVFADFGWSQAQQTLARIRHKNESSAHSSEESKFWEYLGPN